MMTLGGFRRITVAGRRGLALGLMLLVRPPLVMGGCAQRDTVHLFNFESGQEVARPRRA